MWGPDEFKRLAAIAYGIYGNMLIQGGEIAPLVDRQAQEIDVGDLDMTDNRIGIEDIEKTQVFGPKMVTGRFTDLGQDRTHSPNITRAVRVFWSLSLRHEYRRRPHSPRHGCRETSR